jgi:serine/threonine protein kinase
MLPFRTVDHLGMGMSATVNEVEDGTNGMRFAHKIYRPCYGLAHERLKQAFKDEINIIKRLHSHPHIIELYWSYTREKTFGILLTPVASNGDLNAYLQIIQATQNTLTSQQFSVLSRSFGCLASGLAFIHSRTIRHKDIKPQNILVHNGKMIYTDFGIALDGSEQDTTTTGRPDAFTKRYCAPEVANSEPRNRKSDVFSLGCVFLEIMALLAPGFNGGTSDDTLPYWQRVIAIQNNLIHLGNSSTSSGQVLLICKAMLESRSEDRVGADAVLYQVRSLRGSCLEPTYELLCEDCEGFPTNVAQTAMNKGAVAISDRRSDVCSQGKTDNCQEEDGKFQVETPIVPSVLAIDPQACKS